MKRVLFIISGISLSGAEKVLEDYLNNNDAIDPVFLFIFDGDAHQHFLKKYKNVFLVNLHFSKFKLTFLPWKYFKQTKVSIYNVVNQMKCEVVYFNNTMESYLGNRYISQSQLIKTICHIHDMKESFRFIIKKHYIKCALKHCDDSITVSNKCKDSWNQKINHVIYNGIDMNQGKLEFPNKSKSMTFIGSTNERKGLDILFEIIEHVNCIKNYNINIILNDKLIESSHENIHIFCKLPQKEVYEILSKSKYLIVPSRHDPLPTVVMEGILMQNVIIGNNVDGIPEMLPDKSNLAFNNSLKDYFRIFTRLESATQDEINAILLNQTNYLKKHFDIKVKREKINDIILNN